jgi:hypothetical protein
MQDGRFTTEAAFLISGRVRELSTLTFSVAAAMPESVSEVVSVAGHMCELTMFRQRLDNHDVLVTVQIAHSGSLGIASYHFEQGLVFGPSCPPRRATEVELSESGG